MTIPMTQALSPADRALTWAQQAALVVVASIFVALCARVTLPLPFTPVPLTMQNFGVLLVGLMLVRERGSGTFFRAATAGVLAEILLFASGTSWLVVFTHSFAQALRFGFYWFIFAEIIKVMLAAGVTTGWRRMRKAKI